MSMASTLVLSSWRGRWISSTLRGKTVSRALRIFSPLRAPSENGQSGPVIRRRSSWELIPEETTNLKESGISPHKGDVAPSAPISSAVIYHRAAEVELTTKPTKSGGFPKWTSEEVAKLRCLKESGLSWKRLQAEFPSRTIWAIRRKWYTSSVPDFRREQGAKSAPILGPVLGRRMEWTPEEIVKLYRLKESGVPWNRIHAQFPLRTMMSLQSRWTLRPREHVASTHWTAEEDEKLLMLGNAGCDWDFIRKEFPRHPSGRFRQRWKRLSEETVRYQGPRRWTQSELSELRKLSSEGRSWPEIGATLRRSIYSCQSRIRADDVKMKASNPNRHQVGLWLPAEDERLAKKLSEGLSITQIAIALERTYHGVSERMRTLRQKGILPMLK